MTRSILWISLKAPSSPFRIACAALPQPRSGMALAAETFAAAVASLLRITPTRTLSAVRVWLRASERISVTDFVICVLCIPYFATELVMAGLVPAIHVFCPGKQDVGARDKPGHDECISSFALRIEIDLRLRGREISRKNSTLTRVHPTP
jgi:hypothetical protein